MKEARATSSAVREYALLRDQTSPDCRLGINVATAVNPRTHPFLALGAPDGPHTPASIYVCDFDPKGLEEDARNGAHMRRKPTDGFARADRVASSAPFDLTRHTDAMAWLQQQHIEPAGIQRAMTQLTSAEDAPISLAENVEARKRPPLFRNLLPEEHDMVVAYPVRRKEGSDLLNAAQ